MYVSILIKYMIMYRLSITLPSIIYCIKDLSSLERSSLNTKFISQFHSKIIIFLTSNKIPKNCYNNSVI